MSLLRFMAEVRNETFLLVGVGQTQNTSGNSIEGKPCPHLFSLSFGLILKEISASCVPGMHLLKAGLGFSQEEAKSIMLTEPYENVIFVGQKISNISDFRWFSPRGRPNEVQEEEK